MHNNLLCDSICPLDMNHFNTKIKSFFFFFWCGSFDVMYVPENREQKKAAWRLRLVNFLRSFSWL